MNRFCLCVLLLFFPELMPGQWIHPEEHLHDEHRKKQEQMRGIETVTAYRSKNVSGKRSRLCLLERYDSTGNIRMKYERMFYRQRNFDRIHYAYDSAGRIQLITDSAAFPQNYVVQDSLAYDANGKVSQYLRAFPRRGESPQTSITAYTYDEKGRIKSKTRSGLKLPVYYHYNEYGNYYESVNESDTVPAMLFSYEKGCLVIAQDQHSDDRRFVYARDSACRILRQDMEEKSPDGTWRAWSRWEYRYEGEELAEFKEYKRKKHDSELKLERRLMYKYNEKGFISQITELDHRGKVKEIRNYFYEYYPK